MTTNTTPAAAQRRSADEVLMRDGPAAATATEVPAYVSDSIVKLRTYPSAELASAKAKHDCTDYCGSCRAFRADGSTRQRQAPTPAR